VGRDLPLSRRHPATIGLLVIAYVVFKTIFEADRRERKAVAEWERSHGASPISSSDDESRPTT
jgi:hypothetical protein